MRRNILTISAMAAALAFSNAPLADVLTSTDYQVAGIVIESGGGDTVQSLDYAIETRASENVKSGRQSSSDFELIDYLEPNAHPPELDLNGEDGGINALADFVYEEGAVSVVEADASASDNDSDILWTLSVAILNLLNGPGELLAADTSGTDISSNYDAGLGLLTLEGPDTLANFQTVLRTIAYNNTAATPDLSEDRSVVFMADDGVNESPAASSLLHLLTVCDPMNVWVKFDYPGATQTGHQFQPFDMLDEAVSAAAESATIHLNAGSSSEPATINKALRLEAVNGTARIGAE